MKKEPLVSIIITTKNEAGVLGRLLKSIKKQSYKAIEMIVVDNHSTDQTLKIAKEFTKKVFTLGPERSAQRNFGVKKSKGKYLLILDADMELTSEVVLECVKIVEEDRRVGGIVIPESSVAKNYWEKVKAFERSFYNESGDQTTDAARFFPKDVFLKVGGYDESITGPEDWDLPESIKKMNYKIVRTKSIIYHYERIKSLWSLCRKKYYYALKSHRYLKKQQIPTVSAKTIYFLRPVFYKHPIKFLQHPLLTIGLFVSLSLELVCGGVGFLQGVIENR